MLTITRYRHGRFWALYDGHDLVVVTVYKRGALEVLRRLQAQAPGPETPTTPVLAQQRDQPHPVARRR
jgi:hypothetical protein